MVDIGDTDWKLPHCVRTCPLWLPLPPLCSQQPACGCSNARPTLGSLPIPQGGSILEPTTGWAQPSVEVARFPFGHNHLPQNGLYIRIRGVDAADYGAGHANLAREAHKLFVQQLFHPEGRACHHHFLRVVPVQMQHREDTRQDYSPMSFC